MAKLTQKEINHRAKEWQRLKTLSQQQKEIIAAKEKAMLLQIEETDTLRRENLILTRKLKNSSSNKRDLKRFIRELAMRTKVLEPETEKDNNHLNDEVSTDFYKRLCKTIKYNRNKF